MIHVSTKEKNEQAQALGKLRWANKSPQEVSEHRRMMAYASAKVRKARSIAKKTKVQVAKEPRLKLPQGNVEETPKLAERNTGEGI